jgi:predicted GIY-YIG superfamily endonuclease
VSAALGELIAQADADLDFGLFGATDRHGVYRVKAWTGLLLYVGCTNDLGRRMNEHRARSPWFPLAHTVEVSNYPSAATALLAEREAIRLESPLFNRITYPEPTTYEADTLADRAEGDEAVAWAMDAILGGIFEGLGE